MAAVTPVLPPIVSLGIRSLAVYPQQSVLLAEPAIIKKS